jgi:hypothetical protein
MYGSRIRCDCRIRCNEYEIFTKSKVVPILNRVLCHKMCRTVEVWIPHIELGTLISVHVLPQAVRIAHYDYS